MQVSFYYALVILESYFIFFWNLLCLFVPWYNGIDSHFIELNNPLLILEFLSTFLSRLMTLFLGLLRSVTRQWLSEK